MTDFDGSSASSDILVTINGVNENPVFGSGTTSATINEQTLMTGVTAHDTATSTISFTDVDYSDTHSATATWASRDRRRGRVLRRITSASRNRH